MILVADKNKPGLFSVVPVLASTELADHFKVKINLECGQCEAHDLTGMWEIVEPDPPSQGTHARVWLCNRCIAEG